MKKNILFLLLTILFINNLHSQNLIANGDFQSGGVGVGFNINSTGYNYVPTATGTTFAGDYSFGANPFPYNTSNFLNSFDHTFGNATGKMMIIDGSTDGGNPSFWKAGNTGGGVCGLTVGTTYTLTFWVKSISSNVTGISTQADINVIFNNANIVLAPASTVVPLPAVGWQKVTYKIIPTNACVNIEMRNINTNPVGNDFAIDDISLTAPLQLGFSGDGLTCFGVNNGILACYPYGGTPPYTYVWSGQVTGTTQTKTGVHSGTCTVVVTDDASGTATGSYEVGY